MTMVAASPRRAPGTAAPPRELPRSPAPGTARELVHGALGCPSSDELTHQDICAALLSAPGLDARRIEVEMTAAGVRLRGTVRRLEDRARALHIARQLAGSRPVDDALALAVDTGLAPSA